MTVMQVVVDSLLTAYHSEGSGKTVLLLHGWGDQAAGWRTFQRDLARHYTVVALDLPGFGGTQAPDRAWGLDDYAQFAAHFLTKIGDGMPYAIIGHSNGGAIAMRGLSRGWLRARKLVLLASAGIRGEAKGRVRTMRYIAKAGKVLAAPLPKSLQQKLRTHLYHAAGSDMLVAEHLQETFKRVVADDVHADAMQITLPTLLIYGAQDQATPPRYGKMFHRAIAGSTLHIVADAGHFVHLDQPASVQHMVEEFLR